MNKAATWICCGVLRGEIEVLQHEGKIKGNMIFLDSLLHIRPMELETLLAQKLKASASSGGPVIVVYGDCCPHMHDFQAEYGARRVNAVNCAQMLVGRGRFRELMGEGAFMLLPEWARRWQEIFREELGLTGEVARELMAENRSALVYLDTGIVPVPREHLLECAHYTGLPWRIEHVGLEPLLDLLVQAEHAAQGRPS